MNLEKIKTYYDFIGPPICKRFILALVVGFLVFWVDLSFVYIMQGFLIAAGVMKSEAASIPEWYPQSLKWATSILIIFGFCKFITNFSQQYLQGSIPRVFEKIHRIRIVEYSSNAIDQISLNGTISAFTDITGRASSAINYAAGLLIHVVVAFLLFIAGLEMAPKEMLLGLSIVIVCTLPLYFLNKRADFSARGLNIEWQNVIDSLVTSIRHNFLLKIYGLIDKKNLETRESLNNYQNHYLWFIFMAGMKTNLSILIGMITIAIIFYISQSYFFTRGSILISFIYIFIRMVQSIGSSLSTLTNMRAQFPAFQNLYIWYLNYQNYINKKPTEIEKRDKFEGHIDSFELQNCSFKYPNQEKNLFEGINLKLKKGDILVITGESGSGKSTLLSLAVGILKPTKGIVKMNDRDIKYLDHSYFKSIGYVGATPYVISTTVSENLKFGCNNPGEISEDDMISVLKKTKINDTILSLPKGLRTVFNESLPISTGQKQRLSIARTLLKKPEVFILDEFTANLDQDTESAILENILPIFKESITIIVTHRRQLLDIATHKLEL